MNTNTTTRRRTASVGAPAHVSPAMRKRFQQAYTTVTRGTDRMMLMAGDQKIEHLNDDFFGTGIHAEDGNPEHLFRIASQGEVGCFAAHHGLISAYGLDYARIPYIVKMNAKTDLVPTAQAEPRSYATATLRDVLALRAYGKLNVVGIGYTLYLGSEYESEMIAEAGQLIAAAHAYGLLTVIWAYPRGKAVVEEKNAHLIAGAAGVASSLGADFVKVNCPTAGPASLHEATQAAGRTGVLVSGGKAATPKEFLQETYDTIHLGGCRGSATGRNVHQRSVREGVAMTRALSALVYDDASVESAYTIYTQSL